ncbi:MAG: hypothetical protein AABZ60_23565 [Planctomycetota bacterium]
MPLQNNTFESIRQVFTEILSVDEPTATVSSVELVLCLVFQFYGQAKDYFGPESFRMALSLGLTFLKAILLIPLIFQTSLC